MFRDTSEELQRLQAELLAEEEPAELSAQEPPDEEDLYDEYEDTDFDDTQVYQNYANGYHAYNSDITDEDLEEYSEAVREGKPSGCGCLTPLIAGILALAILALAGFIFLCIRGYIG